MFNLIAEPFIYKPVTLCLVKWKRELNSPNFAIALKCTNKDIILFNSFKTAPE